VTPAALDYLQVPGLQNGYTSQDVFAYTASSDLGAYGIKMPGAKNGVGVVVGVEQRKGKASPRDGLVLLDLRPRRSRGAGHRVKGQLDVVEFFGEGRVPLLEGRPFADLLSVSASYRYSDYSTGKKTNPTGSVRNGRR